MIALVLLGGMMAWYGVAPTWRILMAPVAAVLIIFSTMGIGAMLGALVAVQRDFRYVLNYCIQIWMFATPAIYRPNESMGEVAQTWVPFNPAHGLIEAFRQSIIGGPINWYSFAISTSVALVLSVFGLMYFRRMERVFADVI
jgi:lipopolysaccharide transport system permease protein